MDPTQMDALTPPQMDRYNSVTIAFNELMRSLYALLERIESRMEISAEEAYVSPPIEWSVSVKPLNPEKAFCVFLQEDIPSDVSYGECGKCNACFNFQDLNQYFKQKRTKSCPVCRELWTVWIEWEQRDELLPPVTSYSPVQPVTSDSPVQPVTSDSPVQPVTSDFLVTSDSPDSPVPAPPDSPVQPVPALYEQPIPAHLRGPHDYIYLLEHNEPAPPALTLRFYDHSRPSYFIFHQRNYTHFSIERISRETRRQHTVETVAPPVESIGTPESIHSKKKNGKRDKTDTHTVNKDAMLARDRQVRNATHYSRYPKQR